MAEEKTKKSEKAEKAEKKVSKPAKKGKSKRRSVPEGNVHVNASYNNTIVTLSEPSGDVIAWGTAGSSGFKGARKSTPYAAQVAAEKAAEKAKVFGFEKAHVFVKGVGPGREQAIRGLVSSGIEIISISDITPIPHNGCRKKKQRRN
jgi:small subunit ribosomal protein S11